MAEYGLSEDGFLAKPLTVIREEMNASLRNAFGNSIDLGDRSIFGQIVGILAEREASIWELAEAVYASQDPDKATGVSLESICTFTGTFRPSAAYSVVTLTLTGTPTTVVAAGKRVATGSTNKIFQTRQNATITALSAWTGTTVYLVGARVTNGGNSYECITTGTSAGSGGPTTDDDEITDGSVEWTYLGVGTGAVDVPADSEETGAITALARDITTKIDAVSGWESVINLDDADTGRDVATDQELRLLREAELSQAGTSTVDAIRAALLEVDDVVAATVFVNDSDVTNSDGLPPHSIEALVRPRDPVPDDFDQTIWDTLLANVAAGIQTYGNTPGTSTDSQGIDHDVSYSQPEEVPVYITMRVFYDADEFPDNGVGQIKEAIVTYGDAQDTGKDVVATSISARAFEVDGVLSVDYIGIYNSAIATPTTWAALTAYSAGNVVVNSNRVYRCTTGGTSAAAGGPTSTSTAIADGSAVWRFISADIAINLRQLATFNSTNIEIVAASTTP